MIDLIWLMIDDLNFRDTLDHFISKYLRSQMATRFSDEHYFGGNRRSVKKTNGAYKLQVRRCRIAPERSEFSELPV